jgi:outer membrane protein OmpA-like peptidoglycan-associated protein
MSATPTTLSIKVLENSQASDGSRFYWGLVNSAVTKELFKLPVHRDMSVQELKTAIMNARGYQLDRQRLLLFGCALDDSRTLSSYGFANISDPLLHLQVISNTDEKDTAHCNERDLLVEATDSEAVGHSICPSTSQRAEAEQELQQLRASRSTSFSKDSIWDVDRQKAELKKSPSGPQSRGSAATSLNAQLANVLKDPITFELRKTELTEAGLAVVRKVVNVVQNVPVGVRLTVHGHSAVLPGKRDAGFRISEERAMAVRNSMREMGCLHDIEIKGWSDTHPEVGRGALIRITAES